MTESPILVEIDDTGSGWITLNRPRVRNAFDDATIAALRDALGRLEGEPAVRAVAIRAAGPSFSAGADLNWVRRMAGNTVAENLDDARALAALLATLAGLGKPTMAVVQGATFGGGVGLVAACDIALASQDAVFSLSEVKLGLIPATIGPYVLAAIGERHARRYFVTGERFAAAEALRIGLVHEVAPADALADRAQAMLAGLAANGPAAMAAAKTLIRAMANRPVDAAMREDTARGIAEIRASEEGREGVAAFLEKRRPAWIKG